MQRLLQALVLLNIALAIFAACPSNQYNNSGTCTNCHWACNTCSGGLQSDCKTCAVNFFIQPGDTSAPYTCLPTCPTHYFGNNTTGSCQICDASCSWCDYSAKNCASCAPNYFWTYADQHTCTPCNPNCDGCWQSANNCVACQPGLTYNADHTCTPPAVTCDPSCAAGQCSGPAINQCTGCDDGFWLNTNNRCKPCNAACATCDTSATHCTGCADGKYLSGSTCALCHADCATCSGPNSDDCLSCGGAKPVLVETSCHATCAGVQKTDGMKCTTCDASCKNNNCRNDPLLCVNCKAGFTKDAAGVCVSRRRGLRI